MKYIPAEKLIAVIERYKQGAAIARFDDAGENADYFQGKIDLCDDLTHIITSLQQEQREVSIECGVRVYPKLDGKPRPWVSLYGRGIGLVSFRDLPELESLGFKDDDTAIITIAKKEESK